MTLPTISALVLDGKGSARPATDQERDVGRSEQGLLWLHLDYAAPAVRAWMRAASGLDEVTTDALLSGDPRPRTVPIGDGLLIVLRGVNVNDGANPEDMVSVRVWLEERRAIALRRHIAPQRETLARLPTERVSWMGDLTRARLRESADRVTRFLETLDAARERAAVTNEELTSRLAEQMNQTMYTLSVVAAIFLPLSLLTGLLGINVGGIPGVDWPWAFALVTVMLVLVGIAEWLWFKRRRLM